MIERDENNPDEDNDKEYEEISLKKLEHMSKV